MDLNDKNSGSYAEYDCKIKKTKKKKLNFSKYAFYNKKKTFRLWAFLHRMASNVFLRMYLKMFYGARVEGKENIECIKKKGAVIVSNHIHPLDIQMISTFVFGMRRVSWLTLSRNFDLNVRSLIRNSGGVPIPETREDKKRCFSEMGSLLKENGLLHVCPEGSLVSMCGEIRPFEDGAFRFAAENGVPVIPVTLRFFEFDKRGKKYKYPKFVIDVGQPVYPTVPQQALKECVREQMRSASVKLQRKKKLKPSTI